ncbi:Aldo/keto reductase [Mucidula mucida]|nr:Aldo/keto reductase [Mucidula mucida]
MAGVPSFSFNDGCKIPSVGMGCWMGVPGGGERVYDMCTKALKASIVSSNLLCYLTLYRQAGYRHFDTASGYANEQEVGRAIRDSGIPRNEIYLTTKLPRVNYHHKVQEMFEESLKLLDCEYIDLYLMHWPQTTTLGPAGTTITLQPDESPTFVETWREMEKLVATGKVKTIGVSNFGVKLLEELLPHSTIIPATNQIECHPCLPQEELRDYCKKKGILITAYSPLGRGPVLMSDKTVKAVAGELAASPAQTVLSWAVQLGIIVVPKSENEERMATNLKIVKLSDNQMQTINGIHLQPGMHKSLLTYHKPDQTVFGWTYKQLGWNMTTGGIVPN